VTAITRPSNKLTKRIAAIVVALALTIAVPAALASSTPARPGVVHVQVQRSGTIVVSGYDGGAPLAPAP
jgi:hypothetical protein